MYGTRLRTLGADILRTCDIIVIKPLPNQVVEDMDAEPYDVAEEQDLEFSALLVPGEPCCNKKQDNDR